MGTLYIVSTPIGNLKDITLRALEVLGNVQLIACEDTRRTLKLLNHYNIKKPLLSYFEGNEDRRTPEIIDKLEDGWDVALVSDAGTPLISDPGFKLVRACIQSNLKVQSIPGASAILTALTSSGLPTDKFLFLGYLPQKARKRQLILASVKNFGISVVLFESPYRVLKTLPDLENALGDVNVVVTRELTKLHEEIIRGKISSAIEYFKKHAARGEFTIVFHSNSG